MSIPQRSVRRSVSLPSRVARRVKSLAQMKNTSASRVIADLIESGLDAREQERKRFFELADRLARSHDLEEQRLLKGSGPRTSAPSRSVARESIRRPFCCEANPPKGKSSESSAAIQAAVARKLCGSLSRSGEYPGSACGGAMEARAQAQAPAFCARPSAARVTRAAVKTRGREIWTLDSDFLVYRLPDRSRFKIIPGGKA